MSQLKFVVINRTTSNNTMKVAILLFVGLVSVFAADQYTTKYDSIDIDAILSNKRLLQNYNKCLLDTGKCNEEGQVLKEVIPDALITACKKCSEVQKKSVEKVIRFLVKEQKADWEALLKKYDPQGIYRKNYQQYYEKVQ